MTKKKQPTFQPLTTQPEQSENRPTQPAFEPASTKIILQGFAIGIICLFGFLLGLGWWLSPTIAATLQSVDSRARMIDIVLPVIFPLFLFAAFYFFWNTGKDWRNTRIFNRTKQITPGEIIALWIDPPRPPGKIYYVGYRFGQDHSAYQKVAARTYSRLAVGQEVPVEYVPNTPHLSRIDLQKQPRSKAK